MGYKDNLLLKELDSIYKGGEVQFYSPTGDYQMSSATTVRYKATDRGFIIVTAIYASTDSKVVVQVYDSLKDNDSTILIHEYVYASETSAIARFYEITGQ